MKNRYANDRLKLGALLSGLLLFNSIFTVWCTDLSSHETEIVFLDCSHNHETKSTSKEEDSDIASVTEGDCDCFEINAQIVAIRPEKLSYHAPELNVVLWHQTVPDLMLTYGGKTSFFSARSSLIPLQARTFLRTIVLLT